MSDNRERAGDSVLGSLLAYYTPEAVTVVQARGITAKDFRRDQQSVVYRAILALHRDGVHVDVLTVEAFLAPLRDDSGRLMLERAGGAAYLDLCVMSAVPGALLDHAFIVAEAGRWDRLFRAQEALANAVAAQDDGALREAVALVKRDVLPDEAPKLRIVKGAA